MAPFRWGVLGSGYAARQFVEGLRASADACAVAVSSRRPEQAADFARRHGVGRAVATVDELVSAPDVDAVYVATPAHAHREHALAAIEAGTPVLVEKPFAVDAAEAAEIVRAASDGGVFCMEAMWTRFLPVVRRLKELADGGALGEVRVVSGSFGHPEVVRADRPAFDPARAGGALLDRCVYPVSLWFHLVGAPETTRAAAVVGDTGVDEDVAVVLQRAGAPLGVFHASLRTRAPNDLRVLGTDAAVHVEPPIYRPFRMTVVPCRPREAGPGTGALSALASGAWAHRVRQLAGPAISVAGRLRGQRITERYAGNGAHYQADEVARCVRAGRLESDGMPLTDSVGVLAVVDAVREQCGLVAPGRP